MKADAILVLGAAVHQDGPSPAMRRRTLHAVKLWKDGAAPVIVPCGGIGAHTPAESFAMREILTENDVPAEAIICESTSKTTFENIQNARKIIADRTIIIVTDTYHAQRAAMVARHFGFLPICSCPAPTHFHLKQHTREIIARLAYAIKLWRHSRQG
ncbi:YdcF family protein [Loktanella sp. S4079]|uniref:YdcF family protein n=1 Tax=Loktanella sp. S4079 TaxID=579483 RepID=UPI0005FA206A|nr:YdcF family protein [Loktanella sp. S4079]KJZ20772.1 hypothetical protein TW80_08465 [Loktanella sp. S4079]